jgi:hypothetical protein
VAIAVVTRVATVRRRDVMIAAVTRVGIVLRRVVMTVVVTRVASGLGRGGKGLLDTGVVSGPGRAGMTAWVSVRGRVGTTGPVIRAESVLGRAGMTGVARGGMTVADRVGTSVVGGVTSVAAVAVVRAGTTRRRSVRARTTRSFRPGSPVPSSIGR